MPENAVGALPKEILSKKNGITQKKIILKELKCKSIGFEVIQN